MDQNLVNLSGEHALKVTQSSARASFDWIGRGDEWNADQAAVDSMCESLNLIPFKGLVVVGEGERDHAPMLYRGQKLGRGWDNEGAHSWDIAVDPLEGTALTAQGHSGAMSVIAFAQSGGILNAPDVYMDKIAACVPEGVLDLSQTIEENIHALARVKGVSPNALRICILKRERHQSLINRIRALGCAIFLIQDGDIGGILATVWPESKVDMYVGIGGAPEGILAAAALKSLGGWMQGRFIFSTEKEQATLCHIDDENRIYNRDDLVRGDVIFCATGVTDGPFLQGVSQKGNVWNFHSLIMYSSLGMIQKIHTIKIEDS